MEFSPQSSDFYGKQFGVLKKNCHFMPTAKNVLKEKKILAKISASFNRGQDKEVASTRNTDGKGVFKLCEGDQPTNS